MFDDKIKTYVDDDFVSVELSNFDSSAIFTLVFAVIWNVMLLFFYVQIIFSAAPLSTLLFPLIHLFAGLFLLYQGLVKTVNKTNIDIFQGLLSVYSGPIWTSLKNKSIDLEDINQVYVRTSRVKNKALYQLVLVTNDGSKVPLTTKYAGSKLDDLFQVEEILENYLNIPDTRMSGEAHPKPQRVRQLEKSKKIDTANKAWADPLHIGDAIAINNELFEVKEIDKVTWYAGGDSTLVTIESKKDSRVQRYYQEGQLYFLTPLPETMQELDLEGITDWPSKMKFMDEDFELFSIQKGKWQRNERGRWEEIQQIIYQPVDDDGYRYIIQIIDGEWSLYRADIDEETLLLDKLIAPERRKRKIDLKREQ